MNRAATMKSEPPLAAEDDRRAEARSGLDPPHSSLTDGSSDLLPRRDAAGNCPTTKHRIFGSRLGGVKVRHKRQVLQDMARPLKHWLYKHRDNPYPTKTEKVLLALGSHMTLVQVSNWFANARRRLKNTVRQPDLSWAMRIKLYNQYIQGNAERLSVCSDGGDSDDEAGPFTTPVNPSDLSKSSAHQNPLQNRNSVLATADSAHSDGSTSPPSKYKSSLLNRYLNDTLRHMMAAEADGVTKRRIHSETFSEYDQDVVSPASSFETEANFVYQMDTADFTSTSCDRDHDQNRRQQNQIHQGWREIHAAVALTNLAQGQSCTADLSGLAEAGTDTRRNGTREPISARRTPTIDKMCVTGSGSALRQSSAAGPTLASRIIQKSSHISEVQTVNVVLADGAEAS